MPDTPPRQLVLYGLAALAIVVLAGWYLGRDRDGPPGAPAAAPAIRVEGEDEGAKVTVHVAGAVRQPGLYELKEGQRIADAIARAGGATAKADTAAVNLAAPLADGMQVLIPSRVAGASGAAAGGRSGGGGRVSLSSATIEELDELPGIGPVTAQKIVDYRAKNGGFRSVDDLDAIPGIGPARVEQLRDFVTP